CPRHTRGFRVRSWLRQPPDLAGSSVRCCRHRYDDDAFRARRGVHAIGLELPLLDFNDEALMRWHAQLQGCDAASEDSILKAIRLTHRNTVGILVSAVGSQRLVAGSRRRGLRVPAVLPGTPRFAQICGYASPLTHVLEHRHDLLNV